MRKEIIAVFLSSVLLYSCNAQEQKMSQTEYHLTQSMDTITLGGGCFWCIEAQLQQLKGVLKVQSGYAGGTIENPDYKSVCSGITGHAEVIQVTFDTTIISIDELLAAFWHSHDPTQLNKQGNDIGTQYRSIILYRNNQQKEIAEAYKQQLNDAHTYPTKIVTAIEPLLKFYPAEDYHQNYYNQNLEQGYCQYVIQPKLAKFKQRYKDKLK